MANSGVKVTISAADRASSTLEKINKRIAGLQAPVRRAQAAFGRFASLSGLTRLKNGFVGLAREALGAFRYIGQIVPVLGAITGSASLAGMYRLVGAWGQFGTQLRTVSGSMGMAPQKLQAMQNAARLSGSSAEAMTGALQTLSQTRWNALNGMDPRAAAQFKAMHLDLDKLSKEPVDKFFDRVAHSIRGLRDPVARTIAATTLLGGAGEQLQAVLQQSDKEWQRSREEGERHAHMTAEAARQADEYRRSQEGLTQSVEDFGNSIAQAAAPGLIDLNHFLTDLIDTNRDWIAQDIGSYVKQFSYWFRNGGWDKIKTDIEDAAHAVSDVVKELGGWESAGKKALVAIGLLYAAPVLAGLFSLAAAVLGIATAFSKVGTAATEAQVAAQFSSAPGGRAPFRPSAAGMFGLLNFATTLYQAHRDGVQISGEGEGLLDHVPGYTRFSRWWDRMSGAAVAPLDQPVQAAALQAAQKYGLDPDHYIALLRAEHGGTRNVSPAGAFGPSQLMPDTARGLGLPASVDAPGYSWQQNLDGGARYYRQLLTRYQGDYAAADAAYNAGPYSKSVRQFAQTHDPSVLPQETQNYISSIARMSGFKSGPPISLPSSGNGTNGADGAPTTVNVGVAVHAPPGTKVQVTDAPPGANIRPQIQTQRAMPPEITAIGG
ncbi:murein transglycosylase [Komagataeibacter xylinus]|uniref:Murein transglycosylase n=1 Tax=Komagataeibacter xylinus TaxID=28448 RepID=A0A318PJ13_KOMXY|nr:lytic transglycosylase domain-containing protein [Komagataeibacter xylinus]PYD57378.1 murein transglycosylase [Komagataeibacter xylinus]GBQ80623.1 Phage-related tail protein [Komagataeibacter xylinus NBRC 15237]